jgi:UDP-4-amino-4,6-dideoxy-N-acetyl-beta-L-altrosamine transaminase
MKMNPIPYGKQNITQEDIDSVIEVLKSDFLTQGPEIEKFEKNFTKYIGAKYAVAVANGTAALHLCALALNIKPGDKVITTPITFAASANCIRYVGGEVIFADIDPKTYLLDINLVEKLLQESPKGTYKGIIPVDFAGRAIDLKAFRELADKYGCWIIEDACHAPGGFFIDSLKDQQNCGNSNFANLAIFSFHPVKHIAAGEGGMITTNDEKLYKKLLTLRTHGITKNESFFKNSAKEAFAEQIEHLNFNLGAYPRWYYEMQELGYNYRLTDFQAALANSQLKKAKIGLERRKQIAEIYYKNFNQKSFIKGQSGVIEGHAYHLYVIEVDNRYGLYEHLRTNNIYAQIHYIPLHMMPYYKQFGWKVGDLPIAERYYNRCISLPMYPTLTEIEQKFVIDKINEFYA